MFVKGLKLSIVIPTHNRALYLAKTLQSIVVQTIPPFEVIVVNNGSTDHTQDVIKKYMHQLPLVPITEKIQSYAHTRNVGVYKARGDIIALIDDDCEADRHWVQKILHAHTYGTYVIQGIGIENPASRNIYSFVHNLRCQEGYLYGESLSTTSYRYGKQTYPLITSIDNKNVSFSRKLLKKFVPWYAEWLPPYICADDVELAQRLSLSEIKIIYNPNIWVFHQGRESLAALLQRNFEYGKSDWWIYVLIKRQMAKNTKVWKSFHNFVIIHKCRSLLKIFLIDFGLFQKLMQSSQFPMVTRIYGIIIFILAKSVRKVGYFYEKILIQHHGNGK